MKSFEGCLAYIENELGYQLLDWQKEVLHYIYEGKHPIVYRGRAGGITILKKAAKLLEELMERRTKQ